MSRPLPPLARYALAFGAGVLLGLRFPGAAAPAAAALLVGLAAALTGRLTRAAAILALFVAGGAVAGGGGAAAASRDCRARLPDGTRLVVWGFLEAEPWPDAAAPFRVERAAVGGKPLACQGRIWVRLRRAPALPGGRSGALAGLPLRVRGTWWMQPAPSAWPRLPERAGRLGVEDARVLPGRSAPVARFRGTLQRRARALWGTGAGLVEAMLLARREGLDPAIRDRFARSGLSHVLAISGLHAGIIAAVTLLLAGLLRLPRRRADATAALVTTLYVLAIGAPPAAARAALLIGLFLAGRLLQRPADPLALLAAAAFALLALDPLTLLDAGFQLSFAGITGLVLLRRPVEAALARVRPVPLRSALAASLAATAATAPIAALQFGRFAPIGILANLAAIPLAGLAVPTLGVTLAVGSAWPAAGALLAPAGRLVLAALDGTARLAAAVPGGSLLVARDTALGWGAALLLGATAAAALTLRGGIRSWPMRLICAGLAAAALVAWPVAVRSAGGDGLEIDAIDVGQGDAIAVRLPDGRWMLVDAGPRDDRFDAGRSRVVPFLLRHGVRRLALVVLTHADADHIGGARAVLDAFPVDLVVDPGVPEGKPLFLETLRDARAHGARWLAAREGREIRFGDATVRVLAPLQTALDAPAGTNEVSVVLLLHFGHFGALLMGDAPADVERTLVDRESPELRVQVLKVGHHGSPSASSEAFLGAAAPAVALVSVGRHNRFGHPAPEVLARLRRHGVAIWRTDRARHRHRARAAGRQLPRGGGEVIERLVRGVAGARARSPEPLPAGRRAPLWPLDPAAGRAPSGMRGPAAAVTLGRTIVVHPDAPLSARLLRHELAHVRQWRAVPVGFPSATPGATFAMATANPYEVEASAARGRRAGSISRRSRRETEDQRDTMTIRRHHRAPHHRAGAASPGGHGRLQQHPLRRSRSPPSSSPRGATGGPRRHPRPADQTNVHGEEVKKLDDVRARRHLPRPRPLPGHLCVHGLRGGRGDHPHSRKFPTGNYVLLYDPLDGSSNIDANVSVGTIFSIHRKVPPARAAASRTAFSRARGRSPPGTSSTAPPPCSSTRRAMACTASRSIPPSASSSLCHPDMRIPGAGRSGSTASTRATTAAGPRGSGALIDHLKGVDGRAEKAFSSRYVGSLVADFHRTLLYGGLFMYPADRSTPAASCACSTRPPPWP